MRVQLGQGWCSLEQGGSYVTQSESGSARRHGVKAVEPSTPDGVLGILGTRNPEPGTQSAENLSVGNPEPGARVRRWAEIQEPGTRNLEPENFRPEPGT